MFADVVVDVKGPHAGKAFTYRIPPTLQQSIDIGSAVSAPYGKRIVPGWVIALTAKPTIDVKEIRSIIALRCPTPTLPQALIDVAKKMSTYYHVPLQDCVRTSAWFRRSVKPAFKEKPLPTPDRPHTLTQKQHQIVMHISSSFSAAPTFLIHGITGSGKTEVYLQLIERLFQTVPTHPPGVIVLVPEISLTPQMVDRFTRRFPGKVALWHSQLSDGERASAFASVRSGETPIVIGSRSAIFAPFDHLGLIVMDEEHDSSYKQQSSPRYDSRTIASWLSSIHRCPLLLGSATPRVEALASISPSRTFSLPDRVGGGALPKVTIVDLREELRSGNMSPISSLLDDSIRTALNRREQIVLFLNRRGAAAALLCRKCGLVLQCRNCDVALTLHQVPDRAWLLCHHCGLTQNLPSSCPRCQSFLLRPFGVGTQKVEAIIRTTYPTARIARMDRDSTTKKGSHAAIYRNMADGKTDILIGTQMLTKGWDIPNVTVVGILAADMSLTIPDFSSNERTFQLLTQVSGRAGRGQKNGTVVIQTYNPDCPVIQAVARHDMESFVQVELKDRKTFFYPPFVVMAQIFSVHRNEAKAEELLSTLKLELDKKIVQLKMKTKDIQLLGPTPTLIPKLRGLYSFFLVLKAKDRRMMDALLDIVPPTFLIDVDPITLI